MRKDLKIGLALGGGAAKGFAHLGVLEVLEKHHIKPAFIAGTSMGSLMGALYASGLSVEEIKKEALQIKVAQIADFNLFSALSRGILGGKKLSAIIEKYAPSAMIENFPIPYCAVSVDLLTGKPYLFKSGKVSDAVRASCSVPGMFEPVKKDDMILIDGGVINNVPYDVVRNMGADYVIAVDVIGPYCPQLPSRSIFNILLNSFNMVQCENERHRPKSYDYKLTIEQPDIHVENFKLENIEKSIEYGKLQAEKQIKELLKDLKVFKK